METRTENLNVAPLPEQAAETAEVAPPKMPFVEPAVSFPVDVLESTTFFQFTESGVIPP